MRKETINVLTMTACWQLGGFKNRKYEYTRN